MNGLMKVICKMIAFTGSIVPKRKKLVLFGAMDGWFYGDNSKYVFEYCLKNMPMIDCFWVTRSDDIYKFLVKKGLPVLNASSIKGIWCLIRANVCLFTNSLRDFAKVKQIVPKNLKLIALRHGQPIKKTRFAREIHKISLDEKEERLFESKLIKYVISTSQLISEIQEECLRIGIDKSVITGLPRNDVFFDEGRKKIIDKEGFNVLYGPSWRHDREATRFFPFDDFDEEELFTFLENHTINLFLRPHKNDFLRYPELVTFLTKLVNRSDYIHYAMHDQYPDVNSILPDFDALISDYSALYHDFLLLDRPLLFIPYDYEDFAHQNGFLYDYKGSLPGPFITDKVSFYNELSNIRKGLDEYSQKRRHLTDLIHKYKDGNSTKRVVNLLLSMVE